MHDALASDPRRNAFYRGAGRCASRDGLHVARAAGLARSLRSHDGPASVPASRRKTPVVFGYRITTVFVAAFFVVEIVVVWR